MSHDENTQAGEPPANKSGVSFCSSTCSTMLPLWGEKSAKKHSWALQAAKMMAPEHPSIWTLLRSTDAEILKITEQGLLGDWIVVPSVFPYQHGMMSVWGSCAPRTSPNVWPGLAYMVQTSGWLGPLQEGGDDPMVILLHMEPSPLSWASGGGVSQVTMRTPLNWLIRVKKVMLPVLGVGLRLRQHQSPSPQCPSWHQSPSSSLSHDPVLLMSGSVTPLKISIYNWDSAQILKQGAKQGDAPCTLLKRKQWRKKQVRFWYEWGVGWLILHCLLAWPSS